jgi:hypothetical protein
VAVHASLEEQEEDTAERRERKREKSEAECFIHEENSLCDWVYVKGV